MDRGQQGVSLQRFDHPRMQYQHGGGGRGRAAPFARGGYGRGGRGGRGRKQFYPPQPISPGLPPQHRYEVLMEAGRLAAEYLVAQGVLPPASLQRGGGGGWRQVPPPLEAPPFYDSRRNGRQRLDDEFGDPNPRSRRSNGGDYSNGNYDGRGKRKFGAYNRSSEWGQDRERGRGYLDSRNYDDDEEEVEEGEAPGYRRERRGSGVIDDVGSSLSGVAGEAPAPKVEAVGESELEDTGSKAIPNGNARKDVNAVQAVQDDNEAKKMQEDSKVSSSVVVEQGMNSESFRDHASSSVVEEGEIKHSPLPSDDKVSTEKPDGSSIMDEKAECDKTSDEKAGDKASDEKLSSGENNLNDDCQNWLSHCSFAKAPTRPRSILPHRNGGAPAYRDSALAKQVDLVPPMAIDEAASCSYLTNVQGDNKDDLLRLERTDPSIDFNQMVEQERLQEQETRDMREKNITAQHYAVQEVKEHDGLYPTLTSRQDSFKLQIREGVQIYNIDTPPQDEGLIDSADKGKTVSVELLPNIRAEAVVKMEEEKLGQSSSFKIRDLNLIGSPEHGEIRHDPGFGQCSTTISSMEAHNQQHLDFVTTMGNASNTDRYSQIPLDDKVVIDIEDDSPIGPSACDTSRAASEMVYSSIDTMMHPAVNTNIFPGLQDDYNLAIPDFLGADIPCYPPIQTDVHAEMGLNESEVITVMDDPIYGSLTDIGFMEVWDQQPPDYAKFF